MLLLTKMAATGIVTVLLLFSLVENYVSGLNRKLCQETTDSQAHFRESLETYLCQIGITRRKFPLRIRPLENGGKRAYLTFLIILSGDVELNPGPSSKCSDCNENEGFLCQGDLMLCKSCEHVRFPLKDQADETNHKPSDKRAKRQDPKQTASKNGKKEKPLLPQCKITNLNSVEKIYNIDSSIQIPAEHPTEFLKKFIEQSSYYYTTSNNHLASTILSLYNIIYESMGDDESFDISWTDLINEKDILDEISINMVKLDENWVNINIHIPSATVVITGEGFENFKNTILPKIVAREQLYFEPKNAERNDPQSTASSTSCVNQTPTQKPTNHPSVVDLTTKNQPNESIWKEINTMKKDICSLKALHSASKNSDKQQENNHLAHLQDENRRLVKENRELKDEILALKTFINDKPPSNFKPVQEDRPWQTVSRNARNVNTSNNKQASNVVKPKSRNTWSWETNRFGPLANLPQSMPDNAFQNTPPQESMPSHPQIPIRHPPKASQNTPAQQPKPLQPQVPTRQNRYSNNNTQRSNAQQTTNNSSPQQQRDTIVIIGDSMIKDIQPHKLARSLNAWVNRISISGMTSVELKHYLQPSLSKKPAAIIIHCGINDLMQSVSLQNIHQEIKSIINDIKGKLPNCEIYLSSVIHQMKNKNLNTSVDQLNTTLNDICNQANINFLDNENISEDNLNNSGLHLNKRGTARLACNFRDCIKAEY